MFGNPFSPQADLIKLYKDMTWAIKWLGIICTVGALAIGLAVGFLVGLAV